MVSVTVSSVVTAVVVVVSSDVTETVSLKTSSAGTASLTFEQPVNTENASNAVIKNDAFFNLTPHFVILCNYSIFLRDLQYFFR